MIDQQKYNKKTTIQKSEPSISRTRSHWLWMVYLNSLS